MKILQNQEARRAYRKLLVTTPGLDDSISGAILIDETIRQQTNDGIPFLAVIARTGIISGIKVDTGVKRLAGHPGGKITEGLDGLDDRLAAYFRMGARSTQRPAGLALDDGLPTRGCIEAIAQALARYASLCQEAGLVRVVEPEVLMDGDHTLDRCREVTEEVFRAVFDQPCRAVPAAVPGIAVLSGGQSTELASARLYATNVRFQSRMP